MARKRNRTGGGMREEYRIIDYQPNWYLEKLKFPGVWDILDVFNNKEEAIKRLKEVENEK